MKTRNFLTVLIVVLCVVFATACQDGTTRESESDKDISPKSSLTEGKSQTLDLTIKFLVSGQSLKTARTLAQRDDFYDITSVTTTVKQGSTVRIDEQPFSQDGNGVWSGTLLNIPMGVELTFISRAYNASNMEVFSGTTVTTIQNEYDNLTITLGSTDGTFIEYLPKIEQVSRPKGTPANLTGDVKLYLTGNYGETLTWEVTTNDGSFSTSNGTIELAGTLGTVAIQYNAPDQVGTYTHTLKVTNSSGNSVRATFDTVVVDTWLTLQRDILTKCVSCHNNVSDVSGNNLSFEADQYTNLVENRKLASNGLPYIDSKKNSWTYIISKIEGSGLMYSGSRMPASGPYLSTEEITRVKDWVTNGSISTTGTLAPPPGYPVNSWIYVQTKSLAVCTACHTNNDIFPITIPDGDWDRAGQTYNSAPRDITLDITDRQMAIDEEAHIYSRIIEDDERKRMPLAMPALTTEQIQIWENWMNSGFPLR